MATLVVKEVVLAVGLNPLDPAYVECAAGGDVCPNDGYTFLHIKNTADEVKNVSIDSLVKCDQGVDDDIVSGDIAITTGEMMIGPFDRGRFNNPAGQIVISYPKGVEDAAPAGVELHIAAISVKP